MQLDKIFQYDSNSNLIIYIEKQIIKYFMKFAYYTKYIT